MLNFNWQIPTKFIFGRGAESHAGEELKALGGTRALIHYGGGSVIRSGLMEKVTKSLDEAGVSCVLLGGAVPNPRDTKVYEGIDLARREKCDCVLAVGGGSAIDIYTWHGYNDTPELFGTYDRIMEYRKFIREKTGKEFLMWNTEQYYGYRNSGIPESDAESGARYFRDSELEYAAVCANNLIHHAAGGAKWSSFGLKYFYSGLRGSDEQLVFDALSSMNAAIEFLSNAGRGEEVNLGDALKCFFFPQAQGAPLAVLYATNPESKGEMRIPDGVGVYDMNGNRVADNKVEVGYSPLYLKFKKGNARSILAGLEFRNLGKPFSARLRLSGKDTLLLNIGNRTNRPEKIQVSFSGLPSGWRLENPVREIIPGPGEKKELEFKILQSDFEPMKPYVFKIGIRSPRGYDTETVRLAALFARYAEDTPETGWITLDEKNLAIDHNPSDKWKGPEDLGAKFVCYWNENGFGLTVAVTDDKFVFPDNAPKAWDADSLQLYFDMKRDATPFSGSQNKNRGDDCDYNISLLAGKIPAVFLEMGCDARFIGEANLSRGLDPAVRRDRHDLSRLHIPDKLCADNFTFFFRIRNIFEFCQKTFFRININKVGI